MVKSTSKQFIYTYIHIINTYSNFKKMVMVIKTYTHLNYIPWLPCFAFFWFIVTREYTVFTTVLPNKYFMLFTEDRGNKSQVIGFILLGLAKGILGKVSKLRTIFAFNLRGGGGMGVINPKLQFYCSQNLVTYRKVYVQLLLLRFLLFIVLKYKSESLNLLYPKPAQRFSRNSEFAKL